MPILEVDTSSSHEHNLFPGSLHYSSKAVTLTCLCRGRRIGIQTPKRHWEMNHPAG